MLIGDSGFGLFTVNLPGARFLGCWVVSIQAPMPLRMNEAPSSASTGDEDEQGRGERSVACLGEAATGIQVRLRRAWAWSVMCPALAPKR